MEIVNELGAISSAARTANSLVKAVSFAGNCLNVRDSSIVIDSRYLADLLCNIRDRIETECVGIPEGADGEPLEIGSHYFGKDGREWTVLGFRPNRTYDVVGQCGDEVNQYLKGVWLMGERPDTQERIDEDKKKTYCNYWECTGTSCDECPAVADGKEPNNRYGVRTCAVAMGYDLALRQAKLDAAKVAQ